MDNEPTLEINNDGDKEWRLNGKLHRVGAPAIQRIGGEKWWILNGKLHRVDGPAIEHLRGYKEWWLDNGRYSFDDWLEANNYISEEEKLMLKLQYG
jgi:hypothetical protein